MMLETVITRWGYGEKSWLKQITSMCSSNVLTLELDNCGIGAM